MSIEAEVRKTVCLGSLAVMAVLFLAIIGLFALILGDASYYYVVSACPDGYEQVHEEGRVVSCASIAGEETKPTQVELSPEEFGVYSATGGLPEGKKVPVPDD